MLRAIDLELWPGEVHALIGQNGAGKTTLVGLLAGAIAPDGGRVEIAGHRLRPRPRHAAGLGVRCIHQVRALAADLTVADNVAMSVREGVWRRRHRDAERARRALRRLGSDIDVQRRVAELGPGEAQLVEIARALDDAAVLVTMDEPTAALSRAETARLLDTVRSLRSANVAILFVSHDLEEVAAVADRVTVLRDGRAVLSAAMADIDRESLVDAMLGCRESFHGPEPVSCRAGGEVLALAAIESGALRGIDLSLRAGEVLGVTGILGSGIDDIARIAAGAMAASAGEVRVGGRAVRAHSPSAAIKAGVSYVPDDRARAALFPTLRALEHVDMGRLATSGDVLLRRRRERAVARQFAARVHLAPAGLDMPVLALSGGNQQKVVVARALRTAPRVLVAHEPTAGVDVAARRAIHDELARVCTAGGAVLLVSSDFGEIAQVADRVVVVRRGLVVFDGRPGDAGTIAAVAMGDRR